MKILVVSNMYPSDKDPVYGTFVRSFVEGVIDRNIGGKCELVAIRGKRFGVTAKILAYIEFYSKLTWQLLFNEYDLVYVHTVTFPILPIRFVSLFRRLPLVFNVHGDDVLPGTRLKKWLKNQAAKILPKAKLVVAPSAYFRNVVLREFPGVRRENVFVSPSGGVDECFFVGKRDDFSDNRPFVSGFVSRIDQGKGWDLFVKAVSKLREEGVDCRGVMVGRGAESDKLQSLIRELGMESHISYLGAVEHERLPEIYGSFDLLIFPTEREAESLGLVGLEAMAAGVPVIAGNIGGPSSYVRDGENGYLFTPGDYKELVSKVNAYLALDNGSKKSISSAAYQTACSYQKSKVNDQLYDKLLAITSGNE